MCTTCGSVNCECGQLPQGPPGSDGLNAYTALTADFTQPAVGSNVTISVSVAGQNTGLFAGAGQTLHIVGGGYYQHVSTTNPSTLVVKNLGYPDNAAPAATVSNGSRVSPAGPIGSDGINGVAVLDFDPSIYSHTGTTNWYKLYGFNVPANTLVADEEYLEAEFSLFGEALAAAPYYDFRVSLDSNVLYTHDTSGGGTALWLCPWLGDISYPWTSLKVLFRIFRVGTTKIRYQVRVEGRFGNQSVPSVSGLDPIQATGSLFSNGWASLLLEEYSGELTGYDFTAINAFEVESKSSQAAGIVNLVPMRLIKASK